MNLIADFSFVFEYEGAFRLVILSATRFEDERHDALLFNLWRYGRGGVVEC